MSGSGSMHNALVGGEHVATGTGSLTATGVEVVKPSGNGCKVFTDIESTKTAGEEGVVHSRPLKATTAGQGDATEIRTRKWTMVLFTFIISNCKTTSFNRTYEVTGSVKTSSIDGATSNFTEANTTEQGTLKLGGQKAGINGLLTISGRDHEKATTGTELTYTPLSVITQP